MLLADFPVVILDEPAEHLDEETADELTRDLLGAVAGRTVLLITHRPVDPATVDQVLRLADGRVTPARPGCPPGPVRPVIGSWTVTNATDPTPWVSAVRASHDRLSAIVAGLDADGLRKQSYAKEWTIADVLSHLGSGAEIFSLVIEAGVTGAEPPTMEAFQPIWDTWNARTPRSRPPSAPRRTRRWSHASRR